MTILILASLLIVALGAADVVMSGIKLSGIQEKSTLAFYASESGAERFLWEARKNSSFVPPDIDTPDIFGTVNLSNGSYYNVNYGTSTPNIYATSTGAFLGTKRSIFLSF